MFKVVCIFMTIVVLNFTEFNSLFLQCVCSDLFQLSVFDLFQFCVFTIFFLYHSDRIVVHEEIFKALQKRRNFIHVEVHAEFSEKSY